LSEIELLKATSGQLNKLEMVDSDGGLSPILKHDGIANVQIFDKISSGETNGRKAVSKTKFNSPSGKLAENIISAKFENRIKNSTQKINTRILVDSSEPA